MEVSLCNRHPIHRSLRRSCASSSPRGQQLLASLQQLNSNEINSAMADAAAGNYDRAQKTISAFLATPEAKKLLSQVEGGK